MAEPINGHYGYVKLFDNKSACELLGIRSKYVLSGVGIIGDLNVVNTDLCGSFALP